MSDTEESKLPGQEPTGPIGKPSKTTSSQIDAEDDNNSLRGEGPQPGLASSEYESTTAPAQPTPRRQPSPSGATAFDPEQKKGDDTPPDPVRNIRFGPITPDDLTVRWSASHDDTAVVGYQVWLDGFRVATTTRTHVTVNWFNDDMGQHVVQVKALDSAGNLSRTSEIVVVSRPTAKPSTTASPKPSATPTESQKPNSAN